MIRRLFPNWYQEMKKSLSKFVHKGGSEINYLVFGTSDFYLIIDNEKPGWENIFEKNLSNHRIYHLKLGQFYANVALSYQ